MVPIQRDQWNIRQSPKIDLYIFGYLIYGKGSKATMELIIFERKRIFLVNGAGIYDKVTTLKQWGKDDLFNKWNLTLLHVVHTHILMDHSIECEKKKQASKENRKTELEIAKNFLNWTWLKLRTSIHQKTPLWEWKDRTQSGRSYLWKVLSDKGLKSKICNGIL